MEALACDQKDLGVYNSVCQEHSQIVTEATLQILLAGFECPEIQENCGY
jgi:hypothetical protein